jgi:hypothetical protein
MGIFALAHTQHCVVKKEMQKENEKGNKPD